MTTAEVTGKISNRENRLPSVVFSMKYGNDVGFVWRTIALNRDLLAKELQNEANCLLAFPELSDSPSHSLQWAKEIEADFYDYSDSNKIRLAEFIEHHGVAVIFFMSAWSNVIDLPFLRKLGVHVVNTENDSYDHKRQQSLAALSVKFIVRRLFGLQMHDLHIANSVGQYEFLRRFAQIPSRRLRLVLDGIDTDYFQPGDRATACAALGLDPGVCWIMAASQARPEKRVDLLIQAVQKAKNLHPEQAIGFFYVGGGEMLDPWRAIAADLEGAAAFRFFGSQPDLRLFYQAASIFIHGSSRESFGLVIAESMASGLPVLATHSHGPSEIIRHGSTGYLVDRDDWDGFVAALVAYIEDPDLRRRHGEAGRARCLEHFSIARQARELATLIRPFLLSASSGKGSY